MPSDPLQSILEDRVSGASALLSALRPLLLRCLQREGPEAALQAAQKAAQAHPTMAPLLALAWGLEKTLKEGGDPAAFLESFQDDLARLVERARPYLEDKAVVATYSRSGTVLALLKALRPQRVLISEGRPAGEGWVMAREIAAAGIPVTLYIDAALPGALQEADALLLGADAVVGDRFFCNKVGTLPLVLTARHFEVPVFVAAGKTKFLDEAAAQALRIPDRPPEEVGTPPPGVEVVNRSFEAIPLTLVTALISDIS